MHYKHRCIWPLLGSVSETRKNIEKMEKKTRIFLEMLTWLAFAKDKETVLLTWAKKYKDDFENSIPTPYNPNSAMVDFNILALSLVNIRNDSNIYF